MKKLLLLLLIYSSYLCVVNGQVPTTNLAAEYKFTNGTLTDGIGSNDLTQTGSALTLVDNRANGASKAISLNGDYLQRPAFTNVQHLSVSYWIKTTDTDGVIIDHSSRTTDANVQSQYGWYTFLQNGKVGVAANFTYKYRLNGSDVIGENGYASAISISNVADGAWHHVAISLQKRIYYWQNSQWTFENTYKVYVDGILEKTIIPFKKTGTGAPPLSSNMFPGNSATVGNIKDGNSASHYSGIIDDIRFYEDHLLTVAEVISLNDEVVCSDGTGVTPIAQDITRQLDATGNIVITAAEMDNGSFADCDAAFSLSIDKTSFSCADIGANTVMFTVIELSGTQSSTTATVTILPAVATQDITVQLDASGNATITPADVDDESAAICSTSLTYSLDITAFTCADLGANIVTLTIDDGNGNIGTETGTVTVEDALAPTAIGQNLNVLLDATTRVVSITPAMVDNGSTDNCGGVLTMSLSKSNFRCEDTGDNTVTLTVEDGSGNIATTDVTVTVTSDIVDETVTAANTAFCPDGNSGTTISTGSSQLGFEYSLRNSATNAVVDGPIAGTGNAIDFATGNISETTTFNVYSHAPSVSTNTALSFDGINDFVEAAVNPAFDYDNAYTIEAWVKVAIPVVDNYPILTIGNASIDDIEIYVQANTNDMIVVHDRGDTNFGGYSFIDPPSNQWFHFAVTYDGTDIKVYYDGIEQITINNTFAPTGPLTKTAGLTMKIAKANQTVFGSGGANFKGQLDEVRLWTTAKTANEILASKDNCLDGTETDLEYYFRFDDNTGTTATDLVNGTNGTLTNMLPNTDWIASDNNLICSDYTSCDFQMSTEITIGDDISPTALAQDISVDININTGIIEITPDMIDNGSTDNCSSAANMIFTLDKSSFTCDDLGQHTVTLTVTDEGGNEATATATVTITSIINDETVAVTNATLCPGEAGGATVSIASSVVGVNYSLRNSQDDSIVDGPIAGTGNAIDFNTGTINETTTFNVFGGRTTNDEAMRLASSGDAYVSIPNSASLQLDANWTLESWIKPKSGLVHIIESYNGAGGFVLRTNGTKFQAFAMFSSASSHNVVSNASVQLDVWTHVAATFNETTNELKIYINGVLDATNSNATIDQRGPTTNIKIGARGDDAQLQGEHVQSDVRIWNIERSAQEISGNMSSALLGDEAGLVAYLDFNDLVFQASNMPILDKSTNNNNGVTVGSYDQTDIVAGNIASSSCGFQMTTEVSLTIEDNIAPTAIAQNITLQLDATGNITATAADLNNGSTDNCAATNQLTYSLDISTFTCADLGVNNVMLTVTDLGSNQSTVAATITIEETAVPVAIAQDIAVVLDNAGNISIAASDINNGSNDNCTAEANLILSLDVTAFTCANLGTNTVTLTVEDSNGNQSTASSTVTVTENTAPTVIAQNITIELDATGSATAIATNLNNGSTDNCTSEANLAYSLDIATFDCTNLGENAVVLTVTDESGNATTSAAIITVVDLLAPTVTSQNIIVQLDATGNATITAADINNGSSDNCTALSNLAISIDLSTFTCTDLGANNVTLTITDENGNSATSIAIVTVQDTMLPAIALQNLTVQLDANGSASITAADVNNGSSDNCTSTVNLILSIDNSSFDCSNIGANAVILSITDASGNVSQGVSVITIEDNIAPVVITQNINVRLDVHDMATITIADIDNGSSDNCNAGTLTLDITSFNLSNLGANTVTLTYDDGNGNSNSATAIVTIQEYKQAQTISFDAVADKTYGDADITLVASASSGLSVSFTVISGPVTLSGNTASITGVGDVVIEIAQAGDDDFAEASEQVTFTINKAALTATADAQSITYGDAIPALTFTYSGFVNEETSTALTSEPTISTNANNETVSGIGSYDITLTGGEALNYSISLVNASLEITKAVLTITADDKTITYGDAIPELTITYDGFVNEESASVLTVQSNINTNAHSESSADVYTISISGAAASNYEITEINGTLTIEQIVASITITDLEYEEDGTAKSPTVTTDPANLGFTITYDGSPTAPISGGEYEVVVTINEVNYKGTSTATMIINSILAIGDEAGLEVNIYPNPVSDILTIDSENGINGKATLFNIKGEEVMNSQLLSKHTQLSISTLHTGLYILVIQDEKSAIIKKQTVLIK